MHFAFSLFVRGVVLGFLLVRGPGSNMWFRAVFVEHSFVVCVGWFPIAPFRCHDDAVVVLAGVPSQGVLQQRQLEEGHQRGLQRGSQTQGVNKLFEWCV